MKVTSAKNCYCHTCEKYFHYLGIAKHRMAHRDREEICKITYTNGDTYTHNFKKKRIYIQEIPAGYSCNARKGVKRGVSKELIISNLKLPPFK